MPDLPEPECDTNPEALAGDPVPDPWDLPDELPEDVAADQTGEA